MDTAAKPLFNTEEIKGIRDGIDGVKQTLPARFYYDPALYELETERLLKKNWICAGRWDQVEKPGDYFTVRVFGEPVVVVRDRNNELHALINVCQHRWSQVVEDGSGNTGLFQCPYHHWTYNLDGTLRGISVQTIPEVTGRDCRMPELRVEIWQGFVFINFDINAAPLSPRLAAVTPYMERYKVSNYRLRNSVEYEGNWNWKFSFETGYEAYHHAGIHHDRINHISPASNARPLDFGEICGSYTVLSVDETVKETPVFIAVYPHLIMFLNGAQVTYIHIEHDSVDRNRCATRQAFAPAVLEAPDAEEIIERSDRMMKQTQDEDTHACTMLQKGVTSRSNTRSVVHPLEPQLNHYHNWYLDQLLAAE